MTALGCIFVVFGALAVLAWLIPMGRIAIQGGRVEAVHLVERHADHVTVRITDSSLLTCAGDAPPTSRVRVIANQSRGEVLDWTGAAGGAVALASGLGAIALARLEL